PVYDTGPALGAAGERRSPRDERVDQRVVPVPGSRMDHEAGGLVDHSEVLVFPEHDERDRRGPELPRRLAGREGDGQAIASDERPGRAGPGPGPPGGFVARGAGG